MKTTAPCPFRSPIQPDGHFFAGAFVLGLFLPSLRRSPPLVPCTQYRLHGLFPHPERSAEIPSASCLVLSKRSGTVVSRHAHSIPASQAAADRSWAALFAITLRPQLVSLLSPLCLVQRIVVSPVIHPFAVASISHIMVRIVGPHRSPPHRFAA